MKPISPLGFIDKKISNVPGKWSKERAKNSHQEIWHLNASNDQFAFSHSELL